MPQLNKASPQISRPKPLTFKPSFLATSSPGALIFSAQRSGAWVEPFNDSQSSLQRHFVPDSAERLPCVLCVHRQIASMSTLLSLACGCGTAYGIPGISPSVTSLHTSVRRFCYPSRLYVLLSEKFNAHFFASSSKCAAQDCNSMIPVTLRSDQCHRFEGASKH